MCYHINQKSHRDCAPIWFDFEWISTSTIDSTSDNTDVELTALKRVRCERAPNNTRKSLFLCCVLYEHIVNNNNNNEWAIAKRKQKKIPENHSVNIWPELDLVQDWWGLPWKIRIKLIDSSSFHNYDNRNCCFLLHQKSLLFRTP